MSRRILLADDSVTIQKVIELTFMDDDYEVRAVGNGDEALAMLTALQVDFVIADVHMPGASGYEVCRRSKQVRPEVPVLLLVGTFEPFDEAQARAAGADSFLKKPFDSQELLGRVHELLGGGAPASAAAAAPTAPAAEAPLGGPAAAAAASADHAASTPAAAAAPAAALPVPGNEEHGAVQTGTTAGTEGTEHGIEAAPSWQEFELEAEPEPELIPDPWEELRAAPAVAAAAPAPAAPPHFEQPFALGDLDEPEPLQGHALPATAGFEPPTAPQPPQTPHSFGAGNAGDTGAAGTVGAGGPPGNAGPAGTEGTGGDVATVAAVSDSGGDHRPFTLDEPLDERAFPGEPADSTAGARQVDRPTVAEPVFSFAPPAQPASPERSAPTIEERAGAPQGQSPFTVDLHETEERIAAHAGHPAFASPASPEAVAAAAEDNGRQPAGGGAAGTLSDAEVERIARRVVELIGEKVVRDVAWEVIPDLAEVVIKDRLRELESQVE